MKKILSILLVLGIYQSVIAQNVGIGTTNPDPSAILQLKSTDKAFFPPDMTTEQMQNITAPKRGMMVYNKETGQYYLYTQYQKTLLPGVYFSRWEPIVTGPRMLAWGYVDSCSNIVNGSGNFTIEWDGYTVGCNPTTNNTSANWYKLGLTGSGFEKDSMLLIVTPVGQGSWDQLISVFEIDDVTGTSRLATVKFTDVSRKIAGWSDAACRRRSSFYFTLYDMRKKPF